MEYFVKGMVDLTLFFQKHVEKPNIINERDPMIDWNSSLMFTCLTDLHNPFNVTRPCKLTIISNNTPSQKHYQEKNTRLIKYQLREAVIK